MIYIILINIGINTIEEEKNEIEIIEDNSIEEIDKSKIIEASINYYEENNI